MKINRTGFSLLLFWLFTGICFGQNSIHQIELEKFNSTGQVDAAFYEAKANDKQVNVEKGGCNLNKIVYGWHPYWSGSAYTNYQWDLLSHFSFFSYEVNPANGQANTTHGWSTSAAVDAALASGNTKVTLCVTLFSDHATFLGNATSRQTLINNLISLIQSRGAHGVNIDFEGIPSSQGVAFCNFMVDLANQMHAAIPGSEVSTVLYAVDWSNIFNFSIMEPAVDHYIIMGYDYYYSGSTTAGPTDPLYHFGSTYNYTLSRSITNYLSKGVPASKLVLGLPYYGWEYPTGSSTSIPSSATGTGSSRTYSTVRNNTNGFYSSANQVWVSDAITDAYVFNNSGTRQLFIAMDSAFNKRLDHVLKTGIAGIGMWALGYDNGYTERWDAIREYMTDCYSTPCNGEIHDFGGPTKDYYNLENYTWTIAPPNAVSIDFNFSSFNLENNWDYLYIYDGPTSSSPQITGSPFTGTNSPGSFTSSSGSVTFRFTSDISTVAPGFRATYTCNTIPDPIASFNVSGPLTICQGDSILLVSTSEYSDELVWSINEGLLSTNSGGETYLIPSSSGTYEVSLEAINAIASNTTTQLLTVMVIPQPIAAADVSAENVLLPNAEVQFTNMSLNANSYEWIFGDGTGSSESDPAHTYSSQGQFTVLLIAGNNSCPSDTAEWNINVGTNYLEESVFVPITIYPNPVNEVLELYSEVSLPSEIVIVDLFGRQLLSTLTQESKTHSIDVKHLSCGLYFIQCNTAGTKDSIPFVKN
jgi:spore germination protein YaaH